MTLLGHTSIGLLVGFGLIKVVPGIDPKTVLISTTVGSICLDLDLLYSFYKRGFNVLDKKAGGHRYYFTHTPFFVLILGLVLSFMNSTVGLFLAIGAMLHLTVDTFFFPEGVNFTFPFKAKRISLFTVNKSLKFWAPKPIAQVDNWKINYLSSGIFWVFEVVPTILAVALASSILYK